MSPSSIIQDLQAMHDRADERDKPALGHALALIEQMGDQLASLKWLASQRYRRSSEKVAPGQMTMDFITHLVKEAQDRARDNETPKPEKAPRAKRKSQLKLLPVETVDKVLDESERQCDCGCLRKHIGFDTSRQVVYQPPKMFVQEERLFKYACSRCSVGVVMAPASPKLIAGSEASSSILAHLVVSKVVDCLPVERIGKQLARHGASLASSTLYDWFAYAANEVALLQPAIHQELIRSTLISLDDTPLPTKNTAHEKNIQRGRLWLYIGDIDRIAYATFSEDWKGKHPRSKLAGFAGDIQGDGYGGISALFHGTSPPQRVGCNDHARRKFVEAMKMGDSRAGDVVALYAKLYAIESQGRQLAAAERLRLRRDQSVPIWADLKERICGLASDASPKGPLGRATTYWRKQEQTLQAYLHAGHLPISNAHVERLLRTVALLRKNALFVGSIEAGHRYAALLTMALNCALTGADPFAYFTWLFDQLAVGVRSSQVLDVLPQAWLRQQQPE